MKRSSNWKHVGIAIAVFALGVSAPSLYAGAYVEVVADLDTQRPGYQHRRVVPEGAKVVHDVGFYIRDPLGSRAFYSIGYIGAIDRGIAFGHMRGSRNLGQVAGLSVTAVTPVSPDSTGWATGDPFLDKAFNGPEVQYLEHGAQTPAKIPANPAQPVVRLDVLLANTAPGDEFAFFVLDYISVWTQGAHASFSTNAPINSMDTGGDAVPDGTQSVHGVDPDSPIASPPAAFEVDFIDGPAGGGPATIAVFARGNLNCDEEVDFADINPFVLALTDPNAYAQQHADCSHVLADINADEKVDFGDINPFVALLTAP